MICSTRNAVYKVDSEQRGEVNPTNWFLRKSGAVALSRRDGNRREERKL